MKNPEDAEDVYEETFLAYFRREEGFESEEHRKAWLIRVTINAAKTMLRKRGNNSELNEEIAADPAVGSPREEIMDLRAAIRRLSPDYRQAVYLFYMQNLTVRQIAAMMDKSESNVKVILHRAREQLKRFLEE